MQETTRTEASSHTPEQGEVDTRLTLSQAARITPGAPTPNCIWRWCRRGVIARSGDRVRLQHVRLGGRIYTTPRWLDDFGQALAEADAAYFDRDEQAPASESAPSRRSSKRSRLASRPSGADEMRRRHLQAERELKEAGL